MNKDDIIKVLYDYSLDKNQFIIISGAALVLLGIIEKTNDIDICVTDKYNNYLLKNYKCKYERTNEFGENAYIIDDVINFGVSFIPNEYEIIEGYKVASLKDCYNLKNFLNRDKDKKIIKKIKKILN